MFKLYRVNDNAFILVKNGFQYEGDLKFVTRLMLSLGVSPEEVAYGLHSLVVEDNHEADYGINKTFIFGRKIA
jgi:hypothetical protein